MPDIMDYSEKINKHSILLDSMAETQSQLTSRQASLERIIKSVCIDYLIQHPDSKSAMDKIEMLAIIENVKHRGEYEELTALRIVVKSLERRMELVEKQMMATQSQMKWIKE